MIWTRRFWVDAGERAIKTAAQAAIATFGVGAGLFDVDWSAALSMTGAAAVLSVLTSIASAEVAETGTASVVRLEDIPGD